MSTESKFTISLDQVANEQSSRLFAPSIKALELFDDNEQKGIVESIFQAGSVLAAAFVNQAIERDAMDEHTLAFVAEAKRAEKADQMRSALDRYLLNTQTVLNESIDKVYGALQDKVTNGDFSSEQKELLISQLQKILSIAKKSPRVTVMGLGEFWAYLEADFSGSAAKASDMVRIMDNLHGELACVLEKIEGK
jgi:hypothetical protein